MKRRGVRKNQRIRIDLRGHRGTIAIAGQDVSRFVQRVEVRAGIDDIPRVTLHLVAADVLVKLDGAEVTSEALDLRPPWGFRHDAPVWMDDVKLDATGLPGPHPFDEALDAQRHGLRGLLWRARWRRHVARQPADGDDADRADPPMVVF